MVDERQQWLERRRKGLGGSDSAAVCGLSKWKSAYDVWLDKTDRHIEEVSGDAIYWGTVLEDVVAQEYAKRTGRKIRRVNKILRHPDYPWMLGNLDRDVVGEPGLLECKTTSTYNASEWGDPGTDQVPNHPLFQVMHYMAITGAKWADVAVLIGGSDFRIYRVPRNEELIAALIEQERIFWEDHVLADVPPDPTTASDFAKRYPTDDGEPVTATDGAVDAWRELLEVEKQAKAIDTRKTELQDALKMEIAEHSVLLDVGGRKLATWKVQSSRRFDAKAFAAAHPDLHAEFTRETTARVFRLQRSKT